MWFPDHNLAFNRNGIDFIQHIYATKPSNVQRGCLHGCHGPACLVKTYFFKPLPSDMMMWMDKIHDHIDYTLMGDSYYCNIGVYAWYLLLKVNGFIF